MISYGFFNSIKYDRLYDAIQVGEIFDGIINDGILSHYGGAFEVSPGGALSVIVATGRCWFDHTWTLNDADLPLLLDKAEMVLNRIDAIVIEVDARDEARRNTIKIVKGTPGNPAQRPELTNTDLVHQHALAYITIPAGCLEINRGHIADNRGQVDCHFADALLDVIDVTELMKQWHYQFDEWFGSLQKTISRYLAIFRASMLTGDTQIVITDLEQKTAGLSNTMYDFEYLGNKKAGQTVQITKGDYGYYKGKIYQSKVTKSWTVSANESNISTNTGEWQLISDPSNTMITRYSVLSFYSSIWGVAPISVEVIKGAVRLTFDELKSNMEVAVSVDG